MKRRSLIKRLKMRTAFVISPGEPTVEVGFGKQGTTSAVRLTSLKWWACNRPHGKVVDGKKNYIVSQLLAFFLKKKKEKKRNPKTF